MLGMPARLLRRRSHNADPVYRDSPTGDYRKGYVFEVAEKATKTEVKQAVETLFKVKVSSVRTAIVEGKERRRGKFTGYRPDWKKAYVKLKDGEKMPEYLNSI